MRDIKKKENKYRIAGIKSLIGSSVFSTLSSAEMRKHTISLHYQKALRRAKTTLHFSCILKNCEISPNTGFIIWVWLHYLHSQPNSMCKSKHYVLLIASMKEHDLTHNKFCLASSGLTAGFRVSKKSFQLQSGISSLFMKMCISIRSTGLQYYSAIALPHILLIYCVSDDITGYLLH